jgi:zinc transport system substrate-binding protein
MSRGNAETNYRDDLLSCASPARPHPARPDGERGWKARWRSLTKQGPIRLGRMVNQVARLWQTVQTSRKTFFTHVTSTWGSGALFPSQPGRKTLFTSGASPLGSAISEGRRGGAGARLSRLAALAVLLAGMAWLGTVQGCRRTTDPTQPSAPDAIHVFVDIPPLASLAERVGGPHVHVGILVQPGRDPHTYEPLPRQMAALAKARLFFKVGMPFEDRLIDKIGSSDGRLAVVDVTDGIHKRPMTEDCGEHAGEADHGEDHAGEPDPHVWLSPPLLKTMAANIAESLEAADPAHRADYQKNLAALAADLDALDARIARELAPCRGKSFYVFHPEFGYFGDAYGLKQEAVEVGGKSPTPRQLYQLIKQARADGVRIIFLQPQFDPRAAEAVAAAIDGAVVPIDPLAKDVIANLEDMAGKIGKAVKDP